MHTQTHPCMRTCKLVVCHACFRVDTAPAYMSSRSLAPFFIHSPCHIGGHPNPHSHITHQMPSSCTLATSSRASFRRPVTLPTSHKRSTASPAHYNMAAASSATAASTSSMAGGRRRFLATALSTAIVGAAAPAYAKDAINDCDK